MSDLIESYKNWVAKKIPATNDWDEELNNISYIRQMIHDDVKKTDESSLREIDQEWQRQLIDNRGKNFLFTYPREGVPKENWWAWIDRLDELTEEQRHTL
jgi:uncharacterized membrane protein YheB (UPF0754 family)